MGDGIFLELLVEKDNKTNYWLGNVICHQIILAKQNHSSLFGYMYVWSSVYSCSFYHAFLDIS
jgi:hypothetical protein